MLDELADLRRKLARAQAYNECLTRHVMSLIETTNKVGAPTGPTLIAACELSLRQAFAAGKEAVNG